MPDRSDQIGEDLRRHDCRRAAAKMDVVHLDAALDLPRYQIDFAAQGGGVYGNGLVAAGNRGVAAAVPAHRPAERNVQIKRGTGVSRYRLEPFGIGVGTYRGRKMRRGRIARVARQPFLSVASRKIWPHVVPVPDWIEPLSTKASSTSLAHPVAQAKATDLALAQTRR